MKPAPRGPETFRLIKDHSERDPVGELAVDHAVPDAAEMVLTVSRWHGAERLETLLGRDG